MIKQSMWDELVPKWPRGDATSGFDHWLRLDTNSKHSNCIFPEISRTKHVSTHGTNLNAKSSQLFERYSFSTRKESSQLDWLAANRGGRMTDQERAGFGNLQYLLNEHYEQWVRSLLGSAKHVLSYKEINVACVEHPRAYTYTALRKRAV